MRTLAFLLAAALFCGTPHTLLAQAADSDEGSDAPVLLAMSHMRRSAEARIEDAFREAKADWDGTRYRMGGMSRSGIDCSALMVVWFRGLFDVRLPRTAAEQAREGERVLRDDLRAGDLVFFSNGGRVSHIGVYVGNDEFAHSASSTGVTVSSLYDGYWAARYAGARRVIPFDLDVENLPDVPSFDFDLSEYDGMMPDLEEMLPGEEALPAEPNAPAPSAPVRSARAGW